MITLVELFRQMASLGAARVRSGLVDLALMLGIGLSLLVAAGYALQALQDLLRPLVGPVAASAMLAVLMGVVALAFALCLSMRRTAAVRPAAAAPVAPAPLAPAPAPTDPAEAAPDLGTSAAFLAGFLLARRLF